MATLSPYAVVTVILCVFVCSSRQSPVLRHDEPEDQSVMTDEEEGIPTIRLGDGSDVAELLEPDLATLCFAQRPDNVCFGSYLNSPQTWSSGRGCLADAGKSCDTIVVMDTYLFPSHIKYTIFLPAVHDFAGDKQQEAFLYRLFITTSEFGQDDLAHAENEAKDEGIGETGVFLEHEPQFFQIYKNSTGMAICRSLVEGESEKRGENVRPINRNDEEKITGGGFVFPSPEEEGNGELVHDPTTGKFFERYTAYSGSLILIGRLRRSHENSTTPLFLDLERDEVVLHLDKVAITEKGGADQLDDGGERKIQQVIQTPVLRLMSRGHDTADGASQDSRIGPSTHTASFGAWLSITSIDIAMGIVIVLLILLLILTCDGSLKATHSPACANKCLQIISLPFRSQRSPVLISEFS